jgi:hypothetical protein
MKSNQISVKPQPQQSLWRELTDEESEKLRGGVIGFGFLNRNNFGLSNLFSFITQVSALVRDTQGQTIIMQSSRTSTTRILQKTETTTVQTISVTTQSILS